MNGLSPRSRFRPLGLVALAALAAAAAGCGGKSVTRIDEDETVDISGRWNDTDSRLAYREAATLKRAIDQVCLFHPADRNRVALAGLSAGASMAALLATLYPESFRAIAMHSGIPPGSAHSPVSALRSRT